MSEKIENTNAKLLENIENPKDKMERLLNMDETSAILGISKATLYSWICKKKIGVVKVSSRSMFDPADIREFINSHKVKPLMAC